MRYIDNGSCYSVQVGRRDVETFRRSWPCSTLPLRAITFQFDKRNGDLVDIYPYNVPDGSDLLALSQDAQKWAEARVK